MTPRKIATIYVLLLICSPFLVLQAAPSNGSTVKDMNVSIEFEKTMFNYASPIGLQLVVLNINYNEYFMIAPQNYLNYALEVYKSKGVSVSERDLFFSNRFEIMEKFKTGKNSSPENAGFEKIRLKKNAILGVKVDLNQMYDLKPGRYLVRLKFYPSSMVYGPLKYVYSPFVQIIIRDSSSSQKEEEKVKQDWENKKPFIKTPEQTINTFFEGKTKNLWEQFFYTIDLRSLIGVFKEFNDAYNSARDEDRNAILEDFKVYLQDFNSNEKILSWDILETVSKKNQAVVKVVVKALVKGMEVNREYHFRLEKKDHWYIAEYGVLGRN